MECHISQAQLCRLVFHLNFVDVLVYRDWYHTLEPKFTMWEGFKLMVMAFTFKIE